MLDSDATRALPYILSQGNSSPVAGAAPELVSQGAEGIVYKTHFLLNPTDAQQTSLPSIPAIFKHRPAKPYRHPTLDRRLTKHRILSEARTLVKCRREGIPVPAVLALDAEGDQNHTATDNASESGDGGWMMIELIEGKTVREALQQRRDQLKARQRQVANSPSTDQINPSKANAILQGEDSTAVKTLMSDVGRAVGRLHAASIVHGDLTTSNMILRPTTSASTQNTPARLGFDPAPPLTKDEETCLARGEIVLIDFGLSSQTHQDEDRAVDLYVLERAFASTHPEVESLFQETTLAAYGSSFKGARAVLKRLDDVRLRGRKRSMLG